MCKIRRQKINEKWKYLLCEESIWRSEQQTFKMGNKDLKDY